ncbi:uncharacterized protein J3R85_013721 [Psidium guajava]|nr:uncharacterized protein J3R85_013721 [Psidium guajava]
MKRVVQVLVEGGVSATRKVVSSMTTLCRSESLLSMAEEVFKRLVTHGPDVLLFGAKRFLGGGSGIASIAIFMLETIIHLRPWKKKD